MPDVGNGCTIAIAGFTANVESIQMPFGTREAIDTSHLGTTGFRTFMPQDLVDPGEIQATFQYDGASGVPPITATAATVTITVPAPPGSTATNTYAAAGFLVDGGTVEMINDDLMRHTVTLQLTGAYTHT